MRLIVDMDLDAEEIEGISEQRLIDLFVEALEDYGIYITVNKIEISK